MKKKLRALILRDAFIRKKVVLASGKTSNYYVDVRQVSLNPEGLYCIAHLVFDLIRHESIDAIGGPTLGADPIISGVCFLAHIRAKKLKGFLVRKAPKKHGRQKLIEGPPLWRGGRVVVVDDVVTSGGSLIQAISVLRAEGLTVTKAISVIDRQEGAAENLAALGVPLVSLFTKDELLKPCRRR